MSGFLIHRVVGSRTVLSTVERDTLRIGRGAGSDLRFDDTAVALEHALLRRSPNGGYEVVDLGSVTGTYRNGEQVSSARLVDGDEIGIGGWVLKVRHSDPEDPLFLHVRSAEAEPRPDAAPVAAPRVDYASAYRLRRGVLNKATLGLLAVVVPALVVAALPLARRLDAFRPGDLAPVHTGRIDASACGTCHTPFLGVADERCQVCHGPGKPSEAPVHAVGVRVVGSGAPACTACHREHLGTDALLDASDGRCLVCHRNLEIEPAPGVEPVFAVSVTRFGGDHPEFRVDLSRGDLARGDLARGDLAKPPPEGRGGRAARRVPVTSPEARHGDPTALRMSHAKHLKPGLVTPDGRVTLGCDRCHALDAEGPTGLAPARFETVCIGCHALTFDDRYPDDQAPHVGGAELRGALYSLYQDRQMAGASVRERRLDALRRTQRRDFASGLRDEAIRAEVRLYQKCARCHRIDLDAEPYPVVDTDFASPRWLPYARFDHGAHRIEGLECEDCHAGARSSETAADLLLPGIASCTPCHGGVVGPDEAELPFSVVPASDRCASCHRYHSGGLVSAGPSGPNEQPRPPPPGVAR